MKKTLLFAIIFMEINIFSQKIPPKYEIATWQNFAKSAVSYTFDDGCKNQFETAVPMFNKYNFKMTLFIVPQWISDFGLLEKAAEDGHEIASHSLSHRSFDEISAEEQQSELEGSKEILNKFAQKSAMTFAYPYCRLGAENLPEKFYIAARACQGWIEKSTPDNYMNISSISCGNLSKMNSEENFVKKFEQAEKMGGWCVLLLHGIDSEQDGYSPISREILEKSLQFLDKNRDRFWVTTFKNAAIYSKEREASSVKEIFENSRKIKLKIFGNSDGKVYNLPLTLRRELPIGWQSVSVNQKGKILPQKIEKIGGKFYVQFNAIPNGETVLIEKNL